MKDALPEKYAESAGWPIAEEKKLGPKGNSLACHINSRVILYISFLEQDGVGSCYRDLDIANATAVVKYTFKRC